MSASSLQTPFAPRCISRLRFGRHKYFSDVIQRTNTDRFGPLDPDVHTLLARFDGDGDGRLTYVEAKEAFVALQERVVLPRASAPPPVPARTPASPVSAPVPARTPASPVSAPVPARTPASPVSAPLTATWDLQVLNGIRGAVSRGQSPLAALLSSAAAKLSNSSKARASASDLLWSFVGMFLAVTALGVMNLHVRSWPVVGEWHQQGLGLLLGSFGTLCVLIFGRPEAEAVRVWNLLVGHVIATATVLGLLHLVGPSILSRALAMALMITSMMFTDSVHPPGGALVLLAVDSATIQRMDWWFMLYPSLAVTIALLLPLGVAINWLKRNLRFDFHSSSTSTTTSSSAASATPSPLSSSGLRPKVT